MLRYLFYGVDHWTYFSLPVVAVAITALVLCWKYSHQVARVFGRVWWIVPCLMLLTILIFRTEYPNYHGDGEMGPAEKFVFAPWDKSDTLINNLRHYQLHNLILYGFQSVFKNPPAIFNYHYMDAYKFPPGVTSFPLDNLLMMQSMCLGAIVVLLLAAAVFRMKEGEGGGHLSLGCYC